MSGNIITPPGFRNLNQQKKVSVRQLVKKLLEANTIIENMKQQLASYYKLSLYMVQQAGSEVTIPVSDLESKAQQHTLNVEIIQHPTLGETIAVEVVKSEPVVNTQDKPKKILSPKTSVKPSDA